MPTVHHTRSMTQMMQMNWNVMVSLRNCTSMSMKPINGVETIVRDGRGFNMTLHAHSFELMHQKTSLSTDDVYNHPERNTDVYYAETLKRHA